MRKRFSSLMNSPAMSRVNQLLDVRMGILGAVFMGLVVYFINYDHGIYLGLIAAGKQALYTFFFGALFVKMAENLAVQRKRRLFAVLRGGIIPAVLTSALTYVLHSVKGTPEPFNSTLPTIVLSWISFSCWSYLKHRSTYSN